jgi:hypothetical protein
MDPLTTHLLQTGWELIFEPYLSWWFEFIDNLDNRFGNSSVLTRTQTQHDGPEPLLPLPESEKARDGQDSKPGQQRPRVLTACRLNTGRTAREVPAAAATEIQTQTATETAAWTAKWTWIIPNTHFSEKVQDSPNPNPESEGSRQSRSRPDSRFEPGGEMLNVKVWWK